MLMCRSGKLAGLNISDKNLFGACIAVQTPNSPHLLRSSKQIERLCALDLATVREEVFDHTLEDRVGRVP